MIEKLFCHKSKTLLDALEVINQNAKGTVFVVDDENQLCGVLTDGDIRRLLLGGQILQQKIESVLTGKIVYARQGESSKEMFKKLNHKIRILPIINDKNEVVDYIEYKSDIHFPIVSPDLKGNELKYLIEAFLSTWISSSGQYIEQFERDFSKFCNSPFGVATSNGTTALHLALTACGIKEGDEVIVPDLTFAAVANTVIHAGATPVLVDIEKESWCIDPKEIEKAITPKTKAVIPVHLYGQPCDMDLIMAIARKHHLYVIEDCAEAHGAEFNGKKVGSFGDIGCFSFFGNKIITTGEGGMCVTHSPELNEKMRILRDHGMKPSKRYWHEVVGFNYRMTNLQAAIGVAQLERVESILQDRLNVELEYRKQLREFNFVEFQRDNLPKRKKITWLVSALINDGQRDAYLAEFKQQNIDARRIFYPLSQMDIYKQYVFSNKVSQEISKKGISFPTALYLNLEVLKKIKKIFSSEVTEVVG